jgi:hypothetical protein
MTALGLDPCQDGYELKGRTYTMFQETSIYPHLRVGKLLWLSTKTP